jgi:CheY-like chemotaxis protein
MHAAPKETSEALCPVVEMMHGTIEVTSTPSKGSTFGFTATFARQTLFASSHDQSVPEDLPHSSFANIRVLIVGNNDFTQSLVQKHIVSFGMRNETAVSAQGALDLMRRSVAERDPYLMVITELHMQDADGLELCRQMKSLSAASNIILLTPVGKHAKQEELTAAGIKTCLFKPVRASTLLDTFSTILLANQAPKASAPEVKTRVSAPALSVNRLRILLAEDNSANQRVLLCQLRKLGYVADAVGNGLEAVEAISRVPYDLILMDCQMPEMDGYCATREIRLREKSNHPVRIIAMTANSMSGDREACLASGMDDYISKPVRVADLTSALSRCLTA